MSMCAKTLSYHAIWQQNKALTGSVSHISYDDYYQLRTESLPFPRSTNRTKKWMVYLMTSRNLIKNSEWKPAQ